MQGWIANTRHGVTRKRNRKRLKHAGDFFKKSLQLIKEKQTLNTEEHVSMFSKISSPYEHVLASLFSHNSVTFSQLFSLV